MWGCAKCGRLFSKEHVSSDANPDCPNCGTGFPLRPWMESKRWTFLLFGFVGLPVVGVILVKLFGALGLSSSLVKQACYFALPALLFITNMPAFLTGVSSGHQVMKRGGQQGLLMVLGFIAFTLLILATGYYRSVVGLSGP